MRCKAHLAEDYGCQAGATSIPTKYRHISWGNLNRTVTLVPARGRALGSWKAWQVENPKRHWSVSWMHFKSSKKYLHGLLFCWFNCLSSVYTPPFLLLLPRHSFKLNTVVDSKVTRCCSDLTGITYHCLCV